MGSVWSHLAPGGCTVMSAAGQGRCGPHPLECASFWQLVHRTVGFQEFPGLPNALTRSGSLPEGLEGVLGTSRPCCKPSMAGGGIQVVVAQGRV